MRAIGNNLIIKKIEEPNQSTKGGLFLAENQREDIRYIEAVIISVGDEVKELIKNDTIFYDRHAGHKIEIDKKSYRVIKAQDIVVVL